MSAWAVPLRQGALKETRTRPPGSAVTAPEGEGRAQEVAAYSPWLLAVATVGGGRGVEIHAEGREGHRRRRGGLGAGREVRAGQRELHAGSQRGVDVEVLVGSANHLVNLREHGRHALRCRRRGGQEAQLAALLLVRTVGDEAVEVYVKAEVTAEALHDRDHTRVQARDRRQAV